MSDKAGEDFTVTITVPREKAETATFAEWDGIVNRALEASKWQGRVARREYWANVKWGVRNA